MIVLCILAVVWLSIRAAATWRMCARMAEREKARLEGELLLGDPQDAPRPSRPVVGDGPQDAVYAPQDTLTSTATVTTERCDGLALTRAVVVALSLQASKVVEAAVIRWGGTMTWVSADDSTAAAQPPSSRSFFDVTPPAGGPACLGGREDDAYLRGWDDAVHWISNAHDSAPPTWGGVAYMTGWEHAVRAIDRARLSA